MDIYEQTLVDLNLAEWPSLQVKLCSPEKDDLLGLLAQYVNACQAKQRADDAFNTYLDHPYTSLQEHWAYMDLLREECEDAFRLSETRLEELHGLL